jgi:hypothetical protein
MGLGHLFRVWPMDCAFSVLAHIRVRVRHQNSSYLALVLGIRMAYPSSSLNRLLMLRLPNTAVELNEARLTKRPENLQIHQLLNALRLPGAGCSFPPCGTHH